MQQKPQPIIRSTRRRGRISYFDPDHEEKTSKLLHTLCPRMENRKWSSCSLHRARFCRTTLFRLIAVEIPRRCSRLNCSHRSWGTQKDSFCLSFTDPVQRRESGKQRENPPGPSADLVRFDFFRPWRFSTVSLSGNCPFKLCFCEMWMATCALLIPSFGLKLSTTSWLV